METSCSCSQDAHKLFNQIKKKIVEITNDHKVGAFLAQRIGIPIESGNAAGIMGTLPHGQDLGNLYMYMVKLFLGIGILFHLY